MKDNSSMWYLNISKKSFVNIKLSKPYKEIIEKTTRVISDNERENLGSYLV